MQQLWPRLREQAGALWGRLGTGQRAALTAGVVVVVGLFAVLAASRTGGDYVPLFTQLRPQDAGEIVSALRERGVPYQLAEGGTAILVPRESVYETRLELSTAGLPRGGVVGFEIFRDSPIGTTDFERMVRYQQALQGELTRTIRELDEVLDARVHIVLPERSVFLRDRRPASASVVLHLRQPLRPEQVRGIRHLVARSVENLQPENVIIVDSAGQILADDERLAGRTGALAVESRLEIQRAYERELELSVQSMLERVFGVGRAVVRVRAELDFDLLEERQELFEPIVRDRGLLRSQQRIEETWENDSRQPAAGVPGVEANVPGYVGVVNAGGRGERIEEISNWELNRIDRIRIATPGAVRGLSVAVWVDGQLDPLARQRVEDMIISALGLNLERGDRVTVEATTFERAEPVLAPPVELAWWQAHPWPLVFVLAGGVLGAAAVAIARRRSRPDVGAKVDVRIEDEDDVFPEPQLTPEERLKRRRAEAIEKMAREKPEEVARLLRTWLTEDEL